MSTRAIAFTGIGVLMLVWLVILCLQVEHMGWNRGFDQCSNIWKGNK